MPAAPASVVLTGAQAPHADTTTRATPPANGASGSTTPSPLPAKIEITGTVKHDVSCSWMPGAKNPSGKAEGVCSIAIDELRITPPLPDGLTLKDLAFDDKSTRVEEPALGKCAASLVTSPRLDNTLTLGFTEPGCSSSDVALSKGKKLPGGLKAASRATVRSRSPSPVIDVTIALAPKP